MTDETLVINSTDSLTPAEKAAVAYLDQRRANPLPKGWAESFRLVPCFRWGSALRLAPPAPADGEQEHAIVCDIDTEDYAIELVFLGLPRSATDPDRLPHVGGFRLQFFRRDHATPTRLEADAVARQFSGPWLGPVECSNPDLFQVLDGDPGDRPFPSRLVEDWPVDPSLGALTRVIYFGLFDPPQPPTDDSVRTLSGLTLTFVESNTRQTFKDDLRRVLKKRLKMLDTVLGWVCYYRAAVSPHSSPANATRARRRMKSLEKRYGRDRLEKLASRPSTTAVGADALLARIDEVDAELRGQIQATRRTARLVTSDRF